MSTVHNERRRRERREAARSQCAEAYAAWERATKHYHRLLLNDSLARINMRKTIGEALITGRLRAFAR